MGHDGGENLLRFDNFRQEVGPSNRRLRSPAGGKTATSRFESILPGAPYFLLKKDRDGLTLITQPVGKNQ